MDTKNTISAGKEITIGCISSSDCGNWGPCYPLDPYFPIPYPCFKDVNAMVTSKKLWMSMDGGDWRSVCSIVFVYKSER